jgi:hypothetical protein
LKGCYMTIFLEVNIVTQEYRYCILHMYNAL